MPYSPTLNARRTPDPLMVQVIGTVGALGAIAHTAFIPLFLWLGVPWLAAVNVASAAMWAVGWAANRRGHQPLAITLFTVEVVVHTVLATSALGLQAGFQYYMFGGIPFTLLNTRWRGRVLVALAGLMTAVFVGLLVAVPAVQLVFPDPRVALALRVANAVIVFSAIGMASYYFRDAAIRARNRLKALAVTDGLTGVLNRRRAAELLDQELGRSAQTGQPFSVVLGEVDHFKGFVDGYGRECGDRALAALAATLSGRLREFDVVGRWGGEEFLVLLPGRDLDGAARVAEALRSAVAVAPVGGDHVDTLLTMTFGVVQSRPSDTAQDVVARADAALYRGKELGQNAVFVAEAATPWTTADARDGLGDGSPPPLHRPRSGTPASIALASSD
jgi:diguanylate cyclase (GGDEF)-like protein